MGTPGLEGQDRCGKYKDMFQMKGKFGEVIETRRAIGGGTLVKKEADLKKAEITSGAGVGIKKEISERKGLEELRKTKCREP